MDYIERKKNMCAKLRTKYPHAIDMVVPYHTVAMPSIAASVHNTPRKQGRDKGHTVSGVINYFTREIRFEKQTSDERTRLYQSPPSASS